VPVDSYEVRPHDEREAFFFTFSRLDESKRIDEIVRAFADRDDRLVVGGDGPEADRLESMATDNVEFRGFLSESEKRDLLARAKGFVFAARNEDFGIVPVEALASGTPVVGVRDGYTRYQIRDGENGLLYDRGSEHLAAALDRLCESGVEWDAAAIAAGAEQYGEAAFTDGMREAVTEARERVRIEP
jgi:glycosyltransferase involved in cell wall biosynthesis